MELLKTKTSIENFFFNLTINIKTGQTTKYQLNLF